jgi:hypothetical protein
MFLQGEDKFEDLINMSSITFLKNLFPYIIYIYVYIFINTLFIFEAEKLEFTFLSTSFAEMVLKL